MLVAYVSLLATVDDWDKDKGAACNHRDRDCHRGELSGETQAEIVAKLPGWLARYGLEWKKFEGCDYVDIDGPNERRWEYARIENADAEPDEFGAYLVDYTLAVSLYETRAVSWE